MGRPTHALAILATVFSAAVIAPAAQAGQVTVTDATSDMSTTSDGGTVIDGSHSVGDVSQLIVRHTRRAVIVKTFFAELAPEGSDQVIQAVRFKTSAGKEFFQRTAYGQGDPDRWLKTQPGGVFVDCPLQVTSDTTADWLRVQFPRSCINRPRWFKVAATSVHYTQSQQWFDDAHKPTAYAEGEWIYTARIRKPS